ncbi:glucuronate isomerase [Maribacter sp. 2210JD10-5]|uniref:glucuronate isomerase n=1 Tax=Maribacter sp. 2210JD10-5 TaxID=3386272 RepID=UPI0039BD00F3
MSTFIHDDFLLQNDFAKKLFHGYAKNLPIIDYHNHLSPRDIADDRTFENCTQIWLAGDHYKWRAMRTCGVNEKYITGKASDVDKFIKWGETVPYTMRNPLYHWTHLELKRYFGIDSLLSGSNAKEVYSQTSDMLQSASHSTLGLLKQSNVELLCTTDDPKDDLRYHRSIKKQNIPIKVCPTFRPDKAFGVENTKAYVDYLEALESVIGTSIETYDDLLSALENRIAFFHENGCRLADHGLDCIMHQDVTGFSIDTLFVKAKKGAVLHDSEVTFFKYHTLLALCRIYHEKGWVQQFHLGAVRNTNTRLLKKLGPDTGFDSIGDYPQAYGLNRFLNDLDGTDQLTKTILYNLNPSDNEVIASTVGNFNDGSIKGKIQFGSAWWFLDQKDGMEKQINALSNIGILSCFIGMLTDSRSFLSFPRHEYFRRILCNLIGKDVVNGELPSDEKWLGKIVSDISYYNSKEYFDFTD